MVCQADDHCFADITVVALWEEEMFYWGDNNHGLANHCQVVIDVIPRILSIFLYDDLCIEFLPPIALDTTGCY